MAVTLYGAAISPFVAHVMLACDFKGIAYQLTMPKDGIKSPYFLKLNPFGKMPTITDGKDVVYESSVIVDFLDASAITRSAVRDDKTGIKPAWPKRLAHDAPNCGPAPTISATEAPVTALHRRRGCPHWRQSAGRRRYRRNP